MKKAIALLSAVCILLSLSGCGVFDQALEILQPQEKVFTVENYPLQITADSTFQEATGGSFDLQITNGKAYISIMAYTYDDLPEGVTTTDVYEVQNEDLFSKRENITVIEDTKTQSLPLCTLTQALYSAEKDGTKNNYATYLLDFSDGETFAWVLITATPSYFDSNREYLHNIVCTLEIMK